MTIAPAPQTRQTPARGQQSPTPPRQPLSGLSVVVPAFNEAGSLARVVRDVHRVAAQMAEQHEIIIIDDGSRDDTPRIAAGLAAEIAAVRLIRHARNRGFGGSQITGFGAARHEFVSLVPADGQFDADDLPRFAPLLADADVVVGYRVQRADSWRRRVNTRVFAWVMRLLFGVRLRDINWVKLFRRSVLDGLELESRGIGVDAEVVVKAMLRGCRFAELQVSYLPRQTGVSTGDKPVNVAITVWELLVLFWRLRVRASDRASLR
jgi:glycosyltransferase involved in cell wall biosynthesis